MAELHRFQDQAKSAEDRAKPIKSRDLDENFAVCRTDIDSSLEEFIKRKDNYPKADTLELASTVTCGVVVLQNGKLTILSVPTSGKYQVRFVDGVASVIEEREC